MDQESGTAGPATTTGTAATGTAATGTAARRGRRKGGDHGRVDWRWRSERRQRLSAFIYTTRCELDLLSARAEPAGGQAEGVPVGWHAYAECLCRGAEQAEKQGQKEMAWALVLDARRSFVPLLTEGERAAALKSVWAQWRKVKPRHWRAEAIADLLAGGTTDSACLMEAILHLDTVDANKLRALRVKGSELAALAVVLLLALAAVVVVLLSGPDLDETKVGFGNAKLVLLAPLFGILGAGLSGVQRTQQRKAASVPDERASGWATALRPITGAAGGFVALAAAQSGVLAKTPGAVLLGAVAAGISERYVVKLVGGDDGGDPERPVADRVGSPAAAESNK